MKKTEAKALGTLVIFVIIASPFIWLYEQIGGAGLFFIVAVCVVLYALSK